MTTTARLTSRAVIAVSGPDWRSFLQGLLTQDVETLAPGELRFAGLLTPQGKLLYDLFVAGTTKGMEDGALLDVQADQRDALIQRLTIYRLRAKVTLEASDHPVLAVFGDETVGPGLYVDPRLPALGARAYDERPANADEDTYDAHRLALAVPGPADWGQEKTYPIEANFDLLAGIDFKKGCFVGQETTSRMKRRGTIKNRMLPITFEGPPPSIGAEVLAGELRAGEVLSGRNGRALALLRLDRIDGAALTVEGRPVQVERPDWIA
ncbi:folate-binding protein YgfZ [Caulobacter sp. BP25]|uniref:CAF17-like 4Fe-4S cluster assembly/insertion protein YgfZ n=1 Tax=Caulobacter sp. BP25 TaxID=2048900 RepID=UPI000C12B871|nr:folate-binding protein YgfZ [Caulobacter sp. BP25]PHY18036.1 glycine cleavage system protein T [Caulobacter sp. BP25]